MFVFTAQDPGPWQSFVIRPDNNGLPINVLTDKYLTEQLMFMDQYNSFIAYQNWLNVQGSGVTNSGGDTTAPLATAFSPADNATNVELIPTLSITFNEKIKKGTGNIIIKQSSDDTVLETINVTSAQVTVTDNQAIITILGSLNVSTEYYVLVDNGAFTDLSGNAWTGISSTTAWSFTAVPITAIALDPADDSTGVPVMYAAGIYFNAEVQPGDGGVIVVYKKSDGSPAATISAPSSVGYLTFSINFGIPVTLDNNTEYYIEVPTGVVKDMNGNDWSGISGDTAWTFTTMP